MNVVVSEAVISAPVTTTTASAGTTTRCDAWSAATVAERSVGPERAAFRICRSAASAVPPPTTRPARWR